MFSSSELERQIHDAEILLQKTQEMWTARSNERELAYEKEMFHFTDGSPLLGQVRILMSIKLALILSAIHATIYIFISIGIVL